MSRSARLTIGALLVGLAGFLYFKAPSAAEPGLLRGIAAVFGVPGLVALVFGVLPGRRASARTKMTFLPARLFGGIGLSVAGVVVLVLYYQVIHVAPQILLVGALIAVPGGLLFAGTSWTEACRTCGVVLDERHEPIRSDRARVKASLSAGRAEAVLALRTSAGRGSIDLRVQSCPRCRKVALLSAPGIAGSVLVGNEALVFLQGLRPAASAERGPV